MAVERTRWTDDRLDQLAERMTRHEVLETRFDAFERRFDDFRNEMREFRLEMRDFRRDISADVNSLRSELYGTRRWMLSMWLSVMVALLAVLVEVLRT